MRTRKANNSKRRRRDHGFTLIEMLVVIGILALLAAIAYPQVLRYIGSARTEAARAQIGAIGTALELYALDTGRFPPQQVGLAALVKKPTNVRGWNGPYLKKQQGLFDPWGRAYQYRQPGKHGSFDVYSLGRDNAAGGAGEDQDVVSW